MKKDVLEQPQQSTKTHSAQSPVCVQILTYDVVMPALQDFPVLSLDQATTHLHASDVTEKRQSSMRQAQATSLLAVFSKPSVIGQISNARWHDLGCVDQARYDRIQRSATRHLQRNDEQLMPCGKIYEVLMN